ncbi:hypothetical protein [uncultured Clostridium sp.]|uniref:hypothetical protein n=1 Tax=uncultured Clostridium sp. TaxID=59620 RepID=UPI00258D25BF|nr:hypothetical protein [uncultured Clostridium sp.]
MIKKILGILIIVIILFLGIGYCTGRKSLKSSEINISLDYINSELVKIDNELINIGNNIITIWQNTIDKKSITKSDMAIISNIKYDTFLENTKEYSKKVYNDGLEAAKVVVAYYNNSGILPSIREKLLTIKNQLDSMNVKNEVEYNSTVIKYNNIKELQELISNPKGDFNTYKNTLYSVE